MLTLTRQKTQSKTDDTPIVPSIFKSFLRKPFRLNHRNHKILYLQSVFAYYMARSRRLHCNLDLLCLRFRIQYYNQVKQSKGFLIGFMCASYFTKIFFGISIIRSSSISPPPFRPQNDVRSVRLVVQLGTIQSVISLTTTDSVYF